MSLLSRTRRVAEVAARYADSVDEEARFPHEAIAASKAEGLLGILVPRHLGGESATTKEVAELCSILGQACGASAMVFAMHHVKLSSLVEHSLDSEWHCSFMRRIAAEQLLIASATTEGEIGGNLRSSICALEIDGDYCHLEKNATVISYGSYADAILVTSRSHPEATSSEQVLTVFLKQQFILEKTHVWNSLGMRGTCSDGFFFKGTAPAVQILPKPFAEIAAQSMLAASHLLWSSVWYGIALDAVSRAHSFVRVAARRSPTGTPPGALRLANASSLLQMLQSNIVAGLEVYEDAKANPDKLSSMGFAVAMNNVKISSSNSIIEIVTNAMQICGIMGYKNGTPFSVGRHLRDAHSAPLMISNDRILGNTSNMLLIHSQNRSLLG